jgi:hypothetical protein
MKKNITLICALGIVQVVFSTNTYRKALPPLSVHIMASNTIACNGGNTGSATVTVSGGSAPYTYSWAPGGETTLKISSLSAGTYTVTVTDATSLKDTAAVTIIQPYPMGVSISLNNNGGPLTAIVDVSGTGAYCCTITDNRGCTATTCVTIRMYTSTGTIDKTNKDLTIYPDPTTGEFTVKFNADNTGQYLLEVTNVLGQIVYQRNIPDASREFTANLNLTNYDKGDYMVVLKKGQQQQSIKKVIVE